MKITIFGYAPVRNVTNLYTLPIVLSVFLNACSEACRAQKLYRDHGIANFAMLHTLLIRITQGIFR